MDLQASGHKHLLFIETEKIDLIIDGPIKDNKQSDKNSSVKVCANCLFKISVCDDKLTDSAAVFDGKLCCTYGIDPLFFEQTEYILTIEGSPDVKIEFIHQDKNIQKTIIKCGGRYNTLSGPLSFTNHVGYSDLIVNIDSKEYLRVRIEVYPSKMDYRKDFEIIRDDINKEIYGLIFDYLQPTYVECGISYEKRRDEIGFITILETFFNRFSRSIDIITNCPHHVLYKQYDIVRADKVKKIDPNCVKWILKHSQIDNGSVFLGQCKTVKKLVTYNTKENKFVKYMLRRVVNRIDGLIKDICLANVKENKKGSIKDLSSILPVLEKYRNTITYKLNNSFLKFVDNEDISIGMSLVFEMALGYRDLFKIYMLLQRGLDLTGNILHVQLKDLALLYEYWCYVKLNSILRKKYNLRRDKGLFAEQYGIITRLAKGASSTIRYTNPANGENFYLRYNAFFLAGKDGLPTVTQIPDNILCLEKIDASGRKTECKYIFDAKYKIDSGGIIEKDGKEIIIPPGPKDEDINTMHRYRDAIVFGSDFNETGEVHYTRNMYGAYILFPLNREDAEKYTEHRYYKSIEKVNIGGLPFLPNSTKLVEEQLDKLISESPEMVCERTILPHYGVQRIIDNVDFTLKNVLVGVIPDNVHYEYCNSNKIYYTPIEEMHGVDINRIEYVALYRSRNSNSVAHSGVVCYGKVMQAKQCVADNIVGIRHRRPKAIMCCFVVTKWIEVDIPNNGMWLNGRAQKEQGYVVRFTNDFLLKQAHDCVGLYLDNKEDWLLYNQLLRKIKINEQIGSDNYSMTYRGCIVSFSKFDITVTYGSQELIRKKYDEISDFSHCFKLIRQECEKAVHAVAGET